jgi:protein-ribulosamine 3-kinase
MCQYAVGKYGKAQLEGEYYSMSNLHDRMAEVTPRPLACGRLTIKDPEAFFYLCDFIEFDDDATLDPALVGKTIALLHKSSFRPERYRFGTDVPTWDGVFEQTVGWEPSWATFFSKMLKHHFDCDRLTNGSWDDFEYYMHQTQEIVIPRLLKPLEENGNRVVPCFIHGDLWEGNFGIEKGTGRLFVFDANGYFAHHEMELGMWRVEHHGMCSPKYREEYLKTMPPSSPAHQFDDRNRLYGVKVSLAYSFHHPGNFARQK